MDKKGKEIKKNKAIKNKTDEKKNDFQKSWEEKYTDMHNNYKRALADYENLLKRTAKEKQEFARYANEKLLYDIIPVYDNLKTSLKHTDKAAENNGWAEGIQYVIKQFKDVLKNVGVEEIETNGKKFDPHTMEAIKGKGNKVKTEIKAGYKLNGKTIIPAKVVLE